VTVFGANLSRPTGSLGQRQKPKEAKNKKGNFLLRLDSSVRAVGSSILCGLEWAPKVRQTVKSQFPSHREKSYESVSKEVHKGVQGSRREAA
jgi:hypothetical protein